MFSFVVADVDISIHVPREGDDPTEKDDGTAEIYFNPRPP